MGKAPSQQQAAAAPRRRLDWQNNAASGRFTHIRPLSDPGQDEAIAAHGELWHRLQDGMNADRPPVWIAAIQQAESKSAGCRPWLQQRHPHT